MPSWSAVSNGSARSVNSLGRRSGTNGSINGRSSCRAARARSTSEGHARIGPQRAFALELIAVRIVHYRLEPFRREPQASQRAVRHDGVDAEADVPEAAA